MNRFRAVRPLWTTSAPALTALAGLRALLRATQEVVDHLPTPGATDAWDAAETRAFS